MLSGLGKAIYKRVYNRTSQRCLQTIKRQNRSTIRKSPCRAVTVYGIAIPTSYHRAKTGAPPCHPARPPLHMFTLTLSKDEYGKSQSLGLGNPCPPRSTSVPSPLMQAEVPTTRLPHVRAPVCSSELQLATCRGERGSTSSRVREVPPVLIDGGYPQNSKRQCLIGRWFKRRPSCARRRGRAITHGNAALPGNTLSVKDLEMRSVSGAAPHRYSGVTIRAGLPNCRC